MSGSFLMCQCATGAGDGSSIALLEGRLTWLVHIVGAIIRGRLSSSSAESQVHHLSKLCHF